jgi:iron complex transport system substrate-binding protein
MKLLSLLPSATEIVYALGGQEMLIGGSCDCDYPEEVSTKPVVSAKVLPISEATTPAEIDRLVRDQLLVSDSIYSLDKALIQQLRPDVILAQDLCLVCAVPSGHVEEALDVIGCYAEVLSLDPHTLEEVLGSVSRVGDALVDAGDDLELGAVVELDAAHDVHLPHLHGAVPLEAAELVPSLLAPAQLDEVVATQTAVDARATRERLDAGAPELVQDPARPPPGVLAAELADHRLQLGGDLVGAARGTVRSVGEGGKASGLVAGDPLVHRLAGHTEALGHFGDLPAVLDHGHDRLVALLHDAQLHEVHRATSCSEGTLSFRRPRGVNDQAEPPSTISRNTCKRSGGAA